MELTVVVREEGEGFWSEVAELPGCFASARTLSELREAVGEAVGLYLWDEPADLGAQEFHVGEVGVRVEHPGAER